MVRVLGRFEKKFVCTCGVCKMQKILIQLDTFESRLIARLSLRSSGPPYTRYGLLKCNTERESESEVDCNALHKTPVPKYTQTTGMTRGYSYFTLGTVLLYVAHVKECIA